MNLITDLEEIARLYVLNADCNDEFRSCLRRGLRCADDKELDALVHEIYAEVAPAIDCTACANCCREMCVSVDDLDIERLAKRLGVSSEEFESQHVAVDNDYGEKFMPEEPCPLLGGTMCTVYEDRPTVCREFPHLDKDGFRSRLLGAFGSAEVCPIAFNVLEELKRRTNWRPRRL
jgi:Fe-S-cluster containining protein